MATAADDAMARYAAGEQAAFAIVYDELAARIFRYLRRCVGDTALAEDLMQQTFLQMHHARASFLGGAAVIPWAYAIARRLMIDSKRRQRREVRVFDRAVEAPLDVDGSAPRGDELLAALEVSERMRETLARLPETQRVAFELLKVEGLTLEEAAAVLGTTVEAVKLRAHRAYVALRAAAATEPSSLRRAS